MDDYNRGRSSMEQDSRLSITPEETRFYNLLIFCGLLCLILFLITYCWNGCHKEDKDDTTTDSMETQRLVTLHEIQPGLMAVKGEDGRCYRILQECGTQKPQYFYPPIATASAYPYQYGTVPGSYPTRELHQGRPVHTQAPSQHDQALQHDLDLQYAQAQSLLDLDMQYMGIQPEVSDGRPPPYVPQK